jgi:hypothetical protein
MVMKAVAQSASIDLTATRYTIHCNVPISVGRSSLSRESSR